MSCLRRIFVSDRRLRDMRKCPFELWREWRYAEVAVCPPLSTSEFGKYQPDCKRRRLTRPQISLRAPDGQLMHICTFPLTKVLQFSSGFSSPTHKWQSVCSLECWEISTGQWPHEHQHQHYHHQYQHHHHHQYQQFGVLGNINRTVNFSPRARCPTSRAAKREVMK